MRLLALFVALLVPAFAYAADVPPLAKVMEDRVFGNAKAPVTIYEYASLTCGHCAHFAAEILPELEKQAIDTGKAKLIFRDFPLDGTGLKAAALARCLPPEQYFPFIKMLFAHQQQWMVDKDPIAALKRYSSLAGLSPQAADACMNDTKILDALADVRMKAGDKYKVEATPTFIFNDGADKIAGAQPIEQFMQAINKLQPQTMSKKPAIMAPVAPPAVTK